MQSENRRLCKRRTLKGKFAKAKPGMRYKYIQRMTPEEEINANLKSNSNEGRKNIARMLLPLPEFYTNSPQIMRRGRLLLLSKPLLEKVILGEPTGLVLEENFVPCGSWSLTVLPEW